MAYKIPNWLVFIMMGVLPLLIVLPLIPQTYTLIPGVEKVFLTNSATTTSVVVVSPVSTLNQFQLLNTATNSIVYTTQTSAFTVTATSTSTAQTSSTHTATTATSMIVTSSTTSTTLTTTLSAGKTLNGNDLNKNSGGGTTPRETNGPSNPCGAILPEFSIRSILPRPLISCFGLDLIFLGANASLQLVPLGGNNYLQIPESYLLIASIVTCVGIVLYYDNHRRI